VARSHRELVDITSIRNAYGAPTLRLREGLALPVEVRSRPAAAAAGGGGGGGAAEVSAAEVSAAPAEAVSAEQWLDVIDLVGMLSVERAAITGIKAEHKDHGMKGCVQVINRLHQLSAGSSEGRALALTFTQTATTFWDTAAKAESSMEWFTWTWAGSRKYVRTSTGDEVLTMAESNKLSMGDLAYWAKRDNLALYKEFVFRVPLEKRIKVWTAPEVVASQIKEILPNLLEQVPEAWQLVPDKAGVLPFNHRYLFDGPGGPGGLSDLTALVPLPVAGGSVVAAELTPYQQLCVVTRPKATLAIYSHLGTGKTTLFKHLTELRSMSTFAFPRVLYISARRTFTQSQMGEMSKDLQFFSYLDIQGRLTQDRLFCQTESLNRFMERDSKELPMAHFLTYNVLILDELESILASLRPSTTMRGKLLDNLMIFHELVRRADIVVAGDAFLTVRSLDVLAELRHDLGPLRLIVNHANPYGKGHQERVMSRCLSIQMKPKSKLSKAALAEWTPRENVEDSIQLFHQRLAADLKAGVKVVVVWGSRRAGLAFEAYINSLDLPGFTYKYFHAENKATAEDLADVNVSWAQLNYLAYSPTITVGINYNPLGPDGQPINCFQRLYIYACRNGATPRDLMQASLRVREIKPPPGSPHLVYVLDHRGSEPAFAGLGKCVERIKELKAATLSVSQQLARLTKRERAQMPTLPSPAELRSAPPWFDLLLARNNNEANVSSSAPEEVYARYLELCGYHQPPEAPAFTGEQLQVDKIQKSTPYADIPFISDRTAEHLKLISHSLDRSLEPLQALAINKYFFHKRMGLPTFDWGRVIEDQPCSECDVMPRRWREVTVVICPHVPLWCGPPLALPPELVWPKWVHQDGLLDLLWRGPFTPACAKPCYLAPSGGGAEGGGGGDPEHKCRETPKESTEGFFDSAKAFKQIAMAKMSSAASLGKALKLDIMDAGGSLEYSQHIFSARAHIMSVVLQELGLDHPGRAHTWTQAEFKELIPKFRTARYWPDLSSHSSMQGKSLMERALYVFNKRDRSGQGSKDAEMSPIEQLSSHLTMIFDAWCMSEVLVLKEHRVYENSKTPTKKLSPHMVRPANTPKTAAGKVSNYFNELQKTPEWKAAATPEEKEALKVAAEAKWEADYPLEVPLLGIQLEPWQKLTCPEDSTTGLLWALVPAFEVGTTAEVAAAVGEEEDE
jgi:hypothetical protein